MKKTAVIIWEREGKKVRGACIVKTKRKLKNLIKELHLKEVKYRIV